MHWGYKAAQMEVIPLDLTAMTDKKQEEEQIWSDDWGTGEKVMTDLTLNTLGNQAECKIIKRWFCMLVIHVGRNQLTEGTFERTR